MIGVLLGKREGRDLELINTVEIFYNVENKSLVIDKEFMANRLTNYKTMYPTLECVGWYSAGNVDVPYPEDIKMAEAFRDHCENPVYLVLNP